jgi:hypothetical protein
MSADELHVVFDREAKAATERLGDITGRSTVEVVKDAMKIYQWILEQQTDGRNVGVVGGKELANFVVNPPAAKQYFSSRATPKATNNPQP